MSSTIERRSVAAASSSSPPHAPLDPGSNGPCILIDLRGKIASMTDPLCDVISISYYMVDAKDPSTTKLALTYYDDSIARTITRTISFPNNPPCRNVIDTETNRQNLMQFARATVIALKSVPNVDGISIVAGKGAFASVGSQQVALNTAAAARDVNDQRSIGHGRSSSTVVTTHPTPPSCAMSSSSSSSSSSTWGRPINGGILGIPGLREQLYNFFGPRHHTDEMLALSQTSRALRIGFMNAGKDTELWRYYVSDRVDQSLNPAVPPFLAVTANLTSRIAAPKKFRVAGLGLPVNSASAYCTFRRAARLGYEQVCFRLLRPDGRLQSYETVFRIAGEYGHAHVFSALLRVGYAPEQTVRNATFVDAAARGRTNVIQEFGALGLDVLPGALQSALVYATKGNHATTLTAIVDWKLSVLAKWLMAETVERALSYAPLASHTETRNTLRDLCVGRGVFSLLRYTAISNKFTGDAAHPPLPWQAIRKCTRIWSPLILNEVQQVFSSFHVNGAPRLRLTNKTKSWVRRHATEHYLRSPELFIVPDSAMSFANIGQRIAALMLENPTKPWSLSQVVSNHYHHDVAGFAGFGIAGIVCGIPWAIAEFNPLYLGLIPMGAVSLALSPILDPVGVAYKYHKYSANQDVTVSFKAIKPALRACLDEAFAVIPN